MKLNEDYLTGSTCWAFEQKTKLLLPLSRFQPDQSDNAQRIHERGLGRRVSIFDDEEKLKRDLEEAIEFCSSEPVVQKMQKISQRIQADSGLSRICDELAKYCEGKVPSNWDL